MLTCFFEPVILCPKSAKNGNKMCCAAYRSIRLQNTQQAIFMNATFVNNRGRHHLARLPPAHVREVSGVRERLMPKTGERFIAAIGGTEPQ